MNNNFQLWALTHFSKEANTHVNDSLDYTHKFIMVTCAFMNM